MNTDIPSNFLPPGFRFQPTIKEIFTYFLPQRLIFGYNALSSFKDDVMEVDLYESNSPEEIFKDPKKTEFYFFTTLVQKHSGSNKKMKRDIQGKGTWSCKSRPVDCHVEIQGRNIKVGTKNLFKFIPSKIENPTISWIMHEYLIDKDYLNSLITENNNNLNEKIAFCYAYKKTEKVQENVINKRKGDSLNEEGAKKDCINKVELTTNNNNLLLLPLAHGHGKDVVDDNLRTTMEKDNNIGTTTTTMDNIGTTTTTMEELLTTCGEDYLGTTTMEKDNNGLLLMTCDKDVVEDNIIGTTTMEKDNDGLLLMTCDKDVVEDNIGTTTMEKDNNGLLLMTYEDNIGTMTMEELLTTCDEDYFGTTTTMENDLWTCSSSDVAEDNLDETTTTTTVIDDFGLKYDTFEDIGFDFHGAGEYLGADNSSNVLLSY